MSSTLARSPIFVFGAAHSGKSEMALQFLAPDRPALVIATADPQEPLLQRRIQTLRGLRPAIWDTVEARYDVAAVVANAVSQYSQILLDSVNLWLATSCVAESNAFDEVAIEDRLLAQVDELIRLMHQHPDLRIVLVSAEVAASLPSQRAIERCLRRLIGLTNQRLASACATVVELKAGIPITLKG